METGVPFRHISTPTQRITLLRRVGVPGGLTIANETTPDLIALAWTQDVDAGHARVVSETLARSSIPALLVLVP
jgi:hypothetical protein